jgi:hypothetical protein
MATNSWTLGTMYYGGRLNGAPFFTQEGGPFTAVTPGLPQGQIWEDWPGPESLVFSYGPWIVPACLHPCHEYNIIQDYDYTMNEPVALLTCPVCSLIQRAVYGTCIYGQEIYDPNVYAVIAA